MFLTDGHLKLMLVHRAAFPFRSTQQSCKMQPMMGVVLLKRVNFTLIRRAERPNSFSKDLERQTHSES